MSEDTKSAATKVDHIKRLKDSGVKNISASAGKWMVQKDQRDKMCMLSDGMLCVLGGHERDMDVLSYKELLEFDKVKISRVQPVPIALLRRMYSELVDTVGQVENKASTPAIDGLTPLQSEVVRLITDAVARKASDIHITVFEAHGNIAIRSHGDLYKIRELPADKCLEYCSAIYQSMCDIADPTYRKMDHQDARMNADYVERCNLFGARVASGPTDSGSRMVIRLLYDSGTAIPTLAELGYLPEHIQMVETMRRLTSGINIVSGGTGSGKSTSLSAILSSIIQDARRLGSATQKNGVEEFLGLSVITIEDPPEYKIEWANQTPLIANKADHEDVKRAWARAISACMRQDPDIMMVGEIRDEGSAKAAFDAALTGHGVWTTVHTTDAVGIMMRLKGLGVEEDRMLDPEIVTGLINQSLAQRLCKHCSISWERAISENRVEAGLRERVEKYCVTSGVRIKGDGCAHCSGSGITGRIVVAEIIMPNLEFMEMFAKEGKTRAKQHWIVNMGGITKAMALIRRINEGLIDPAEGDRNVIPLDRDMISLGVDYSAKGNLPFSHILTLPNAQEVAKYLMTLPKHEFDFALQIGKPSTSMSNYIDPLARKAQLESAANKLREELLKEPALGIQVMQSLEDMDASHPQQN